MIDIKKEVLSLNEELIELRRDFHKYPELGYEEFRTAEKITEYLERLGLKTERFCKTGVVSTIEGNKEGKTIMLRADIDALPQREETNVEYASLNEGKMHACGHDGHTAMLLVAAKILANHKEKLNGNVKLVFQPNEEQAGAEDMIKEGVLENPKVDSAFGIHLWTPVESGKIAVIEGPIMAACEEFKLTVIGESGHTSAPHEGNDPILITCKIVEALQALETRQANPLDPITIMVGKINGGSAKNIIAGSVNIEGTIRFSFEEEKKGKERLLKNFKRIVDGICMAFSAKYELQFIPSNPSVNNDREMTNLVRKGAKETLEDEKNLIKYRCLGGEDFADFTHRVPSAFYFIGAGNREKETHYPHHHPKFNIDEDVLKTGVEMHVRTVFNYLNM
nr:amidohydrolase [Anaeromicrobium sediminis]